MEKFILLQEARALTEQAKKRGQRPRLQHHINTMMKNLPMLGTFQQPLCEPLRSLRLCVKNKQ